VLDGRITLRKLDIFCRVAEAGSISEVARQLDVVQPAVSEHIRTLERRLGCKLLVRKGRGVELTDAGVRLHEWAGDILGRARELDRELEGLESGSGGSAVVGASTTIGTYLLAEAVADFALQRPGARISLKAGGVQSIIDGVRGGQLDFGVVVSASRPSASDISARALLTEPYLLVAAPDAELPADPIDPAALAALRFVCTVEEAPRLELIDRPLFELGVGARDVVVELSHPEAIKRAVRRRLGVAFLMRAAVERELEAGELRAIAVDGLQLDAPVFLVHRADRAFSHLQSDLIRAIEDRLEPRHRLTTGRTSRD
jgi:LysR family transcriptional regulator, low CO2-responsive transcriptional regulator